MWIGFKIILDNPFVFIFLVTILVAVFLAFLYFQKRNASFDESVLLGKVVRPALAMAFVFMTLVGVAFYIEKFFETRAKEQAQGVAISAFGFIEQKPQDSKKTETEDESKKEGEDKESRFLKLGGKVVYPGGWWSQKLDKDQAQDTLNKN